MKILNVSRHLTERNRRGRNAGGHQQTVIYVWTEGETILENLASRRCKPYTAYKEMLEPHLASLGVPPGAELSWDQKAGCKCGCSPGFRLKVRDASQTGFHYVSVLGEGGANVNLHVTIAADEPEAAAAPAASEAEAPAEVPSAEVPAV